MDYTKIKDSEDLVKDKNSGAILNINNDALRAYRQAREKNMRMHEKVNQMENDISEIKSLLNELVKGKKWQYQLQIPISQMTLIAGDWEPIYSQPLWVTM